MEATSSKWTESRDDAKKLRVVVIQYNIGEKSRTVFLTCPCLWDHWPCNEINCVCGPIYQAQLASSTSRNSWANKSLVSDFNEIPSHCPCTLLHWNQEKNVIPRSFLFNTLIITLLKRRCVYELRLQTSKHNICDNTFVKAVISRIISCN